MGAPLGWCVAWGAPVPEAGGAAGCAGAGAGAAAVTAGAEESAARFPSLPATQQTHVPC